MNATFVDVSRLPHDELAARAGAELEGAPPVEVLRWAIDRFAPRFAITASMGDTVLLHMASKIRRKVPVIFLDTGLHFAETVGTAAAAEQLYDIELRRVRPRLSVEQQGEVYGPRLWERDPDLCCSMRKVLPLADSMRNLDAWATGVRRDETDDRAGARIIEWDARRGKLKVNPLVAWSQAQVDAYIEHEGVLVNPLLSAGYGSVGCEPCTHPGEGRSGRWSGSGKAECGLHV